MCGRELLEDAPFWTALSARQARSIPWRVSLASAYQLCLDIFNVVYYGAITSLLNTSAHYVKARCNYYSCVLAGRKNLAPIISLHTKYVALKLIPDH